MTPTFSARIVCRSSLVNRRCGTGCLVIDRHAGWPIKRSCALDHTFRSKTNSTSAAPPFWSSFHEPAFLDTATVDPESRRVWKANASDVVQNNEESSQLLPPLFWDQPVHETTGDVTQLIERIGKQELDGGRMRQRRLGVLREDPAEDMRLLTENYTVPALASAVRDREETLQLCAELLQAGNISTLQHVLRPYQQEYVLQRRTNLSSKLNIAKGLTLQGLEQLRKALMRMPRRVSTAHRKRAGVVLALCNVSNVPCLLLEKRAPHLRAHPDEVCLPGGHLDVAEDPSIVATCLREMHEEIGGLNADNITTLGVLRCNWGEVHHLVGVAVTPLVCFLGDVSTLQLKPNPDEVAEVFTIPLVNLMRRQEWIHREGFAPIFVGGPHVIWGLSGYIIERFVKDILLRYCMHNNGGPKEL